MPSKSSLSHRKKSAIKAPPGAKRPHTARYTKGHNFSAWNVLKAEELGQSKAAAAINARALEQRALAAYSSVRNARVLSHGNKRGASKSALR